MSADPKFTYINSMAPGMKAVNLQFIVLEIGPVTRTKDGSSVRTAKVADQSGSIDMGVWNELGEALRPGDICRLKNGFTTIRKGTLTISCGRMGELIKIGEFMLAYSELPNMSVFSQELLALERKSPLHDGDEGGIPNNGSSEKPNNNNGGRPFVHSGRGGGRGGGPKHKQRRGDS